MGTACEEGACNCSFHKPNMMHPAGCDCVDCIRQFGRDSAKIQHFTDLKGPVEFEGTVEEAKDHWKRKAHEALAALKRMVLVLRPELKDTEFNPVVTALASVGVLWFKYQTRDVEQATYKGGGYEYAVQFETRNPPRGEGWSMYREIENEDYRNDGAPRDLFVWRRKLTDEQSKNET